MRLLRPVIIALPALAILAAPFPADLPWRGQCALAVVLLAWKDRYTPRGDARKSRLAMSPGIVQALVVRDRETGGGRPKHPGGTRTDG